MFDFIRTHQRLMQFVLLILVVPSFVFLGISGYSFVNADPALVEIGTDTITREEFVQAQRNQLQQLQSSSQGRFDPALLDNPAARQAVLDQLIEQKLQLAIVRDSHFSASDAALRRAIAAMPELQKDGQFSLEQYDRLLAAYGMATRDFEASQRYQLAMDTVFGPVRDTASLPKPVLEQIAHAITEERTVRVNKIAAAQFSADVNVSEAQIAAWYDSHQEELRLPDQVAIDYLLLDEAAALAGVSGIEESQLQEYYEQNKNRYVNPARVQLSHILIKLAGAASPEQEQEALVQAQEIAKEAQANPASFAELAALHSQDSGSARDGGRLGWVQRASLPGNIDQAVFALNAGEVSEPVRGPEGYHVFLAEQVQPESGESFEQARAKVEQEVRQQLAAERFADMASSLTNLVYDNPESLEPAAKELGLQVRHASGIARDRLLEPSQAGDQAASASADALALEDVRVRQALFSPQVLNEKQNSGVIEISSDTMLVVRVSALTAAHVPALEDGLRALIAERLHAELALADAVAKGQGVLEELRRGQGAELEFSSPQVVSRQNPGAFTKPELDLIFAMPTGAYPQFAGVELADSYALFELQQVQAAQIDDSLLLGLGMQLAQIWAGSEERAVIDMLRLQKEVKITDLGQKLIAEGDSPQ